MSQFVNRKLIIFSDLSVFHTLVGGKKRDKENVPFKNFYHYYCLFLAEQPPELW